MSKGVKAFVVSLILVGALISFAAAPQTPPPATASQPTATVVSSSGKEKEKKVFKEDELASLLAPVALYPDKVIAQVLVAATYPLEVVQASRWVQKNSSLKGEELAKEARKQPWD